ncbi:MAG: glycoside hydrolase family 18 protein [Chloroflexota bacterium]
MRTRFYWIVGLLLLLSVGAVHAEDAPAYRVVGYFSSWGIYDRNFLVTDIDAEKLTHINYAFFLIAKDGTCMLGDEEADTQFMYPGDTEDEPLRGNFKQLKLLKEAHPGLQTLMSIGGWTGSDYFSDVALTDETRQKFVASCVAMMTQYGFNGIDIDWEYPTGGGEDGNSARPEDKQNFTLLLAEFRKELEAQGSTDNQHYLLTIAAPSSVEQYQNIELDKIIASLDWINVMTYDFSGDWSEKTGFNAPLYADPKSPDVATNNIDSTIQGYLAAGVTADKLVLGVPFYGYGWQGTGSANNGLYQSYTGLPAGTTDAGSYEYYDLAENYVGKFQRFWNDTAKVPWLYDAKTDTMITYDDPESIALKANYVKDQKLGGVMIWELASEDRSHSLLNAVYDTLNKH